VKQGKPVDWGLYITPTSMGAHVLDIDPDSFAVALGYSRKGLLILIRDGHKSVEYHDARLWKEVRQNERRNS
jgi:hypothetical protein